MRTDLYREGLHYVRELIGEKPHFAVILGSGLGDFAERLKRKVVIETSKIPGYPRLTVAGHSGKIAVGVLGTARVMVFQGRVHFYEFADYHGVFFPIHLLHDLGVPRLIVTNAAGGINRTFAPMDLMLIVDHLNFTFHSPEGVLRASTTRFRHGRYYSPELSETAWQVSRKLNIPLRSGVYCGLLGPSYETHAEIEMLSRAGADAVGMSTVKEVALAHRFGIEVLGISIISNMATGITHTKHSHEEVTNVAKAGSRTLSLLLEGIIIEASSKSNRRTISEQK